MYKIEIEIVVKDGDDVTKIREFLRKEVKLYLEDGETCEIKRVTNLETDETES